MKQETGNNSENYQAGGNIHVGLSYTEAKEIALDVFKANFFELSTKAAQTALSRAEELTENFLEKFYNQIPHLAKKLEEPSVQSSIYNAQKEYAKSGDEDLQNNLLSVLIERINSDERSLKQIILDEALMVLPKLTMDQINILSFLASLVIPNYNISSTEEFEKHINDNLLAFYTEKITAFSFFSHLRYVGCCSIVTRGGTYKTLPEIFKILYQGIFSKGFTQAEFERVKDHEKIMNSGIIIRCVNDHDKYQVGAMTDKVLESKMTNNADISDFKNSIKNLFDKSTMNHNEIINYIVNINPIAQHLFDNWSKTELNTSQLTSVGYAIGIINYNIKTGRGVNINPYLS